MLARYSHGKDMVISSLPRVWAHTLSTFLLTSLSTTRPKRMSLTLENHLPVSGGILRESTSSRQASSIQRWGPAPQPSRRHIACRHSEGKATWRKSRDCTCTSPVMHLALWPEVMYLSTVDMSCHECWDTLDDKIHTLESNQFGMRISITGWRKHAN